VGREFESHPIRNDLQECLNDIRVNNHWEIEEMRKPERDGARRGREIFQQKNTRDRISPYPQNFDIIVIEQI
jgi:hypothetical protein